MKRLAGFRIYPFLMAAYPALALLAANADQVRLEVVSPVVRFWLLCAVYAGLAGLVPAEPSATLTTALLLFFAYGTPAGMRQIPFDAPWRHRFPAWCGSRWPWEERRGSCGARSGETRRAC
jgi:hypothetical protein